MEIVTFKLHGNILKKIDGLLNKMNFSNRTEFIREAIRDKINDIETEIFIRKLDKFRGSAKVKVSNKRLREIRKEVFREHAERLGVKLD